MNYIDLLYELCGNPMSIELPTDGDWKEIESELEIKLPDTYKLFINKFGSGRFVGDLNFFNPVASDFRRKLERENIMELICLYKSLNFDQRISYYPHPLGLFPITTTGGEEQFFLDIYKQCVIIIDYEICKYSIFHGCVAEMLYKYLSKTQENKQDIFACYFKAFLNKCKIEKLPLFQVSYFL